jgi:plastocyanin
MRKALAALIGACTAAALAVIVFTAAPVAAGGATVTITKTVCSGGGTKYCYSPEDPTISMGSSVEWINNDAVTHNVAQCPSASICPGAPNASSGWTCGTLSVKLDGGTASCTFNTAGKYYYYCSLHGWSAMHGEITVTGTPPTPTPTAKPPTPTPTAKPPTPTPSQSSGSTPTPSSSGTAPPTAVGATPTPVGATTAPGQTPSDGSTPTATSSTSPTGTAAPVVGTQPGSGGSGGSGFPIIIVIIAVVVIAAGAGAAVFIRRRSTA